jgi:hypothetical protein
MRIAFARDFVSHGKVNYPKVMAFLQSEPAMRIPIINMTRTTAATKVGEANIGMRRDEQSKRLCNLMSVPIGTAYLASGLSTLEHARF